MLVLPMSASAYEKSNMIVKLRTASVIPESANDDIDQIGSHLKVVSKAL